MDSVEKYARCIYDYAGGEDKLALNRGDIVRITQESSTGWFCGEIEGIEGWFPSTYVEACDYQPENEDKVQAPPPEDVGSTQTLAVGEGEANQLCGQTSKTASVASVASVELDNIITIYHDRYAMVDHFWEAGKDGRSGWDHVIQHFHNGLASLEQAHQILVQRAALDREYATGVLQLAKRHRDAMMEGSLHGAATEITVNAMNAEADIYFELVSNVGLGSELYTNLEKFRGEMKIMLDNYVLKVDTCKENKAKYGAQGEKAEANYLKMCRDAQTANKLGDHKVRKKIDALQAEYIEYLKQRNNALQNQIDMMCEAFEAFEVKDIQRIQLFEKIFSSYVELLNGKHQKLTNVFAKCPPLITQISAAKDVEEFVRNNATGQQREMPQRERVYDPRAFDGVVKKRGKK